MPNGSAKLWLRAGIATVVTIGALSFVRPDATTVAGRVAVSLLGKIKGLPTQTHASELSGLDAADRQCPGIAATIRSRLRGSSSGGSRFHVECAVEEHGPDKAQQVRLAFAPIGADGQASKEPKPELAATARLPSWTAIVPPVLAVVWAFAMGKILLSLLLAIFAGGFVLAGFDPIAGVGVTLGRHLGGTLLDAGTLKVMLFTISLVGLVQICVASGGIPAFVRWISRGRSTRRRAQMTTAGLGTIIFFDDYANTMIVGSSMRPLCDRNTTSREKLAYLVDATAAPVAGIAVVSTWIGFEIEQFNKQLADFMGHVTNGYAAFFAVMPFRFYCILSLVLVFLFAWTGRDFGPMRRAERRAGDGEPADRRWALTRYGSESASALFDGLAALRPARAFDGVGPVLLLIAGVLGTFVALGVQATPRAANEGLLGWFVRAFIAGSDSSLTVMVIWGGICTAVAALWSRVRVGLTLGASARAFGQAVRTLSPTLAVLFMALTIQQVTKDLGTGTFLATLLSGTPAAVLPAAVFMLAAAVSFAIGSSYATMGLLIPVALPLARAAVEIDGASMVIVFASAAAVLDGAIFGDHCSPISDTTVMSSAASGCDHLAHVRTQLPYALLGMSAAVGIGYAVSVGLFGQAWIGHLSGAVFLMLAVRLLGRVPAAR